MSAPQARRAATDRLKAYLTRRGTAGMSVCDDTIPPLGSTEPERGVGEHATRAMTEDRAQERVEAARGAQ